MNSVPADAERLDRLFGLADGTLVVAAVRRLPQRVEIGLFVGTAN